MREGGLGEAVKQAYKVYKSIYIMKKKAESGQQSNKLSRIISKLFPALVRILICARNQVIIFLTKTISSHQVNECLKKKSIKNISNR